MCVAIVIPAGIAPPPLSVLEACETANPHGGGIAYVANGAVEYIKGIDAKQVSGLLEQIPHDQARLVHFRIATAGGKSPNMCHPFPLSKFPSLELAGRAKAVLIHNGHLSDWESLVDTQTVNNWSDTRVMAQWIHRHGPRIMQLFRGQKLAVLTKQGVVYRTGDWQEVDKIFYSNKQWQWDRSHSYGGSYGYYRGGKWYESSKTDTYKPSKKDGGAKDEVRDLRDYKSWEEYLDAKYGYTEDTYRSVQEKAIVKTVTSQPGGTTKKYVTEDRPTNSVGFYVPPNGRYDRLIGTSKADDNAPAQHVYNESYSVPVHVADADTAKLYLTEEMAEVNKALESQGDLLVVNGGRKK